MEDMLEKQKNKKYESTMITAEEDEDNGIFDFGSALNKIK